MISTQEIATAVRKLPVPPLSTMRLMRLLSTASDDVGELQQIVEQDPSLASNLLRIANSPYYRGAQPVSSARSAIVRLGARGLYEISMGLTLRRTIPDPLPGYDIPAPAFSRHCVAVAVLSEALARETQAVGTHIAFTVGLLHDVGKLVVGPFLEQRRAVWSEQRATGTVALEDVEKEILNTDHNEVGESIAIHWNLPPEVVAGVRWHHAPQAARGSNARGAAAVAHVANALAHLVGHGVNQGELQRHIDSEVAEQLGVRPRELERIAADTFDAINELAGVLDNPR